MSILEDDFRVVFVGRLNVVLIPDSGNPFISYGWILVSSGCSTAEEPSIPLVMLSWPSPIT